MPEIPSPWLAVMLGVGGGAASMVLPEDAEAISKRLAYQQTLRALTSGGALSTLDPEFKNTVKDSYRNLPQEWFDKINAIRPAYEAYDVQNPLARNMMVENYESSARGWAYNQPTDPTIAPDYKEIYNQIFLKPAWESKSTTPAHEVAHIGHGADMTDLLPGDYSRLSNVVNTQQFKMHRPGLETTTNSRLPNSREVFAESVAQGASGSDAFEDFPPVVQYIARKYFKDGKVPDAPLPEFWKQALPIGIAAGSAGVATLASSDDSEAAMSPSIRKLYQAALKKGGQAFFHSSRTPEQHLEEGINPEIISRVEDHKPQGLFVADTPLNFSGHMSGMPERYDSMDLSKQFVKEPDRYNRELTPNGKTSNNHPLGVRVVLSPDAKVKTLTEDQALSIENEALSTLRDKGVDPSHKDFTKLFRNELNDQYKDYDAVRISNVDSSHQAETIVLNPEKAHLFYEDKVKLGRAWGGAPSGFNKDAEVEASKESAKQMYEDFFNNHPIGKLLKNVDPALTAKYGVAAGAGIAATTDANNVEAMPLGKLSKAGSDVFTKGLRNESAWDRLVGKTLNLSLQEGSERKPYEITDVLKTKEADNYLVILADEQNKRYQLPMTKDYLHVLLGSTGTKDYLDQLSNSSQNEQKLQILKSLNIREARREDGDIPPTSVKLFKDWNDMQAAKAHEIDPSLVHDYVYFQTQPKEPQLYMPRPYAQLLSKYGFGDILSNGPNPSKRK